ncbi:MAG: transglutaminase domain-containing protein [Anaerolineales bacterium]|nr:transglutaminase domain-containing protein [Anaerolineales bacterium]
MKRASSSLWDLSSVALLALALVTSCQRLVATDWTADLEVVTLFALLGLAIGLPVGMSRFGTRGVIFLACGYSLVLLPMLTAQLFYPGIAWLERMASLGGRLGHLLGLFFSREPVEDPFLFVIFMALLYWVISLVAGYGLTRRGDFVTAVLPSGVILVAIQMYDAYAEGRIAFLAVYLLFSLLLLGRLHYARRRQGWERKRILLPAEAGTDLNVIFLAAALILISLAWVTPASSRPVRIVRQAWDNLTEDLWGRDEINNVVAGLNREEHIPINSLFGDILTLGQQGASDNALFFRIRLPAMGNQARYYWRVRSYDEYRDDRWHTTDSYVRGFSPSSRSLDLPDREVGVIGEFTVYATDVNVAQMITPNRPVWVSRPSALTFMPAGEGELDPILFSPDTPIMAGEQYIVHAILLEPTVLELRSAGTEYPDWVGEHFLQLPADLPPTIVDLAEEITAEAETPYDKAQAITDYLRTEVEYSLTVSPTPTGRDPLAWFLFDYRRGFCDYYATAEVVMLRAVGVPARLAVGFAEGVASTGWRTVRQRDSHAWPEVYFPGYGWIEFEPTASEPPLYRPSGEARPDPTPLPFTPPAEALPTLDEEPLVALPVEDPGSDVSLRANSLGRISIIFGAIALLVVGTAFAYIFGAFDRLISEYQRRFDAPLPILLKRSLAQNEVVVPAWLDRWATMAGLTPMEATFRIVYRSLKQLGVEADPARTPAEAAALLSEHLPQAADAVRLLLDEYQQSIYNRMGGLLQPARQARGIIREATRRLRLQRLWITIRRILTFRWK